MDRIGELKRAGVRARTAGAVHSDRVMASIDGAALESQLVLERLRTDFVDLYQLHWPERNVAICKAPPGARPEVELLTKIHRHLLNWAQLQRRNLVINKIKVRPVELPPYKILCVPVRHASGRVTGFLALFRAEDAPDFDPRTERLVELLSRKTTTTLANNYDALTALLTRPAFETQVRGQLTARRQPAPDCVLYLDIDRVHVVNDNFGMHVGDEMIGKVAEVLRKKPRPGALAARIAGDRFAVFLPDCTLEFAQQIGELLRRQCAELTWIRPDGTVQVSVSVGAAELPGDVTVRVHDSNADLRYIVLPMQPKGTEGWSEEKLAALVTRDSMIGTDIPKAKA